jgi:endonuclease YncB( thermonuclease family)
MAVTVNFNFPRVIRSAEPRGLVSSTDGDTTVIAQPIRMVSCDTPEKSKYAGKPQVSQPKLDRCRQRLQGGFYNALPQPLRDYLVAKITITAAERHIEAGERASAAFDQLLETRLTLPDGTKRSVATIPTGEIIDSHGRMLAYIAPWFTGSQSDPLPPPNDPERRTLNLDMIANGWAAFFPIYPSLPKNSDMNLAIAEAQAAWDGNKGAWTLPSGRNLLLGYEYRMCIKLGGVKKDAAGNIVPEQNLKPQDFIGEAFQRSCVDLQTMKEVGLFGFHSVLPWARLWFWWTDRKLARQHLGLPAVND